jgi:hypothetical protein
MLVVKYGLMVCIILSICLNHFVNPPSTRDTLVMTYVILAVGYYEPVIGLLLVGLVLYLTRSTEGYVLRIERMIPQVIEEEEEEEFFENEEMAGSDHKFLIKGEQLSNIQSNAL